MKMVAGSVAATSGKKRIAKDSAQAHRVFEVVFRYILSISTRTTTGDNLCRTAPDWERSAWTRAIRVPGMIKALLYNFDIDGDTVKPGHIAFLQSKVVPLLQGDRGHIWMQGSTSKSGSNQYNKELSTRRVNNIASVLRAQGIFDRQMQLDAVGEEQAQAHAMEDEADRAVALVVLPVARESPPPPKKIPPPPAYVCGPDISTQLSQVLLEVRRTFLGPTWNQSQKREQCDAVRSFVNLRQTLMAWDIIHLYLPNTYWLYNSKFKRAGCGQPCSGEPGSSDIENAVTSPCGNSVQVGNHCYLAGTVNYALFGEICRLCHDEFKILDRNEMKRLIWLWKTLDRDDPIPPTEWAVWGFDRRSVMTPPTGRAENRSRCTGRCSEKLNLRFTWRWLPHHPSGDDGER